MIDFESRLKGGIIGSCIGDALGVPVEFKSRQYLNLHPVADMIGYGTYMQPPGTWSDDSSMQLCTIDSLCKGFDLKDIAINFVKWRQGRSSPSTSRHSTACPESVNHRQSVTDSNIFC